MYEKYIISQVTRSLAVEKSIYVSTSNKRSLLMNETTISYWQIKHTKYTGIENG